jgi:hypothetical protein
MRWQEERRGARLLSMFGMRAGRKQNCSSTYAQVREGKSELGLDLSATHLCHLNVPLVIIQTKMQGQDDLEPTVRIRELKKDRVNFVLENVDLACVCRVALCISWPFG